MRPLAVRFLNLALMLAAIVLAFFSRGQAPLVRYGMLAGVALLVALVLFMEHKFWICPHCKKPIGRIGFFETSCPHCGKSLK